jgi:tetratricopeptide (TPR) repeat protein
MTAGTHRRRVLTVLAVAVFVGCGVGFALFLRLRTKPPPIPQPDLVDADPAVVRAVDQAREAVRSRPREAAPWGRLGMVLAAHGFYQEAAPCFAEAERLEPRELRWPYYLGVSQSVYDPEAALPALRRAVALAAGESEAPRLRLAEVLLGLGHNDEAGELFRRVLLHEAGHPRAYLGLARLACSRNDWAEARTHLTPAAESPLTRKAAQTLLAEVAQRNGDTEAAARATHLANDLPDDPEPPDPYLDELESYQVGRQAQLTRGSKLLKQGRVGEAVTLLRRAARDYPEVASVWLGLGRALIQGERPAEAETALNEAIRLDPDLVEAHFYLGVSHFERGDAAAAAPAFRRATELRPDYALAHYNLGHCLKREGNKGGAITAFREAARLKPHFAQAHGNLGELLAQQGDRAAAREELRQAVRLDPGDKHARDLLAGLGP